MDSNLGLPVTTTESQPALAVSGGRIRRQRSLARAAAILLPLTILGLVVARARTRGDPQLLWDEAQAALHSGKLAAAEAKLVGIRRLRAPTSYDWMLTAQIAVANGRPDEALAALGHIPERDALAGQAFLLAGRIQRQRNRMPAAEAAFRKALACDSRLIEAHKELIYLLGLQLRRHEVDAEFKRLSRLTRLSHHELLTWGLTHFSAWVRDGAEQLESFIQADRGDRYSRLSLAALLLQSPGMESRVERTLEPLPCSDPEATALRIELRLNQGRIDEAMAMLEAAPAGHPHLARIRGRVALTRGDHAAAIRHFQDALSEEPDDRVSLSELSKALLLEGDPSAAERYLARARRLDDVYNLFSRIRRPDQENEASDLTRLGRACEAAGLLDEARGWYLLAIGRDPLDAEAQQALRRLRLAAPP
jgi:tetratricopeptide (TPR) repeat protein